MRHPSITQDWTSVAFVHWAYPREELAALLPRGLSPDVMEGSAWVSLTPFAVRRERGLGVSPGIVGYAETNLRTYVRSDSGEDGLWFFSLDVDNPVDALAGRYVVGAPYFLARMHADVVAKSPRYESTRTFDTTAHHRIALDVADGEPLQPSKLDALLTGRWRAFVKRAGHLLRVPVEHEPWPLELATLREVDETLTTAAGLSRPRSEPIVHFSPGVHASLGWPALVR